MNELRIDSFGGRRVSPFDGSSSFVVMPDVTQDFSSEIVDGGKDASGDDLSLNFGEPDFDLVKPRRIGGRKMNADLRMMGQKVIDKFGFMGREIISDDVDLASEGLRGHHLGKKVDELGAGMALSRLAKDFSASTIEGRVKRKGSMAVMYQNREPRLCREKGAAPDPGGPGLGLQSFRLRKRRRRDQEGSDKGR